MCIHLSFSAILAIVAGRVNTKKNKGENMGILSNANGITIRQLKEYVKNLPETDEFGEDYEVWLDDGAFSNVCKEIWLLNKREDGQDLLLKA